MDPTWSDIRFQNLICIMQFAQYIFSKRPKKNCDYGQFVMEPIFFYFIYMKGKSLYVDVHIWLTQLCSCMLTLNWWDRYVPNITRKYRVCVESECWRSGNWKSWRFSVCLCGHIEPRLTSDNGSRTRRRRLSSKNYPTVWTSPWGIIPKSFLNE